MARHVALSAAGSIPRSLPKRDLRLLYGHGMESRHVPGFRATLRALRQRYEFVTLSDAVALARSTALPDGRYLAFSFDDGFRDNYELVAPTLAEFGARCCFFVTTNFIGCDEGYRKWFLANRVFSPPSKEAMSWEMLRDLVSDGFEIGAHTMDHVDLATIPLDEAALQIRGSMETIQTRLGIRCRWFAWPYGRARHISQPVIDIARGLFEGIFSAERSPTLRSAGGSVLNRDHFEPGWPRAHVQYFLSRPTRESPAGDVTA